MFAPGKFLMRPCNKLPSKVLPLSIGSPESRPGGTASKRGTDVRSNGHSLDDTNQSRNCMRGYAWSWNIHEYFTFHLNLFRHEKALLWFPLYTVMHISWNGTFRHGAKFFFPPQLCKMRDVKIKQEVAFSIGKIVLCCLCFKVFQLAEVLCFCFQRVATMTYTWIAPQPYAVQDGIL